MDFALRPGDTLQLQLLAKETRRFRSKLIGYLVHESVLVTTPIDAGRVLPAPAGTVFAVRAFARDQAVAFKAHVLAEPDHPYPHLHLSYPRAVESVRVRSAVRTDIQRPARVIRHGGAGAAISQEVRVRDLSVTGAFVESASALGEVGDDLMLEIDLDYAPHEGSVRLPASIRNRYDGESPAGELQFRYGLQFRALPTATELLLRAYVFERLVRRA